MLIIRLVSVYFEIPHKMLYKEAAIIRGATVTVLLVCIRP
jgi:hypothetical protein